MTYIDAAVRDALLACTGLTALVSTRIYADHLPPNVILPAIAVIPVSDIPDAMIPDLYSSRVQVSIWSNPTEYNGVRSPSEIAAIEKAVVACLHRATINKAVDRWTGNSETYAVIERTVENSRRSEDPTTGWYHLPVDVVLKFRKV